MALLQEFALYWKHTTSLRSREGNISLSGKDLSLAELLAVSRRVPILKNRENKERLVSRYDAVPELSNNEHIKAGVDAAKTWLGSRLEKVGTDAVYAVNTGVGDRGTQYPPPIIPK
jgi:hypothetical protein